MKSLKVLIVVLPVLLFAVLFVVIRQQRSDAAYLLRQYTIREPGLNTLLALVKRWHLEESLEIAPGGKSLRRDALLLRVSNFQSAADGIGAKPSKLGVTTEYILMAQRKKLPVTFPPFPQSVQPPPPIENLMVVSFRQDEKWHTRLYDRRSPPAVMEEIDYLMHPKSPKWKARWEREQQASKVL
jgi:hypothetical protein